MQWSSAVMALFVRAVVLSEVVDRSCHLVVFQTEVIVAKAVWFLERGRWVFNDILVFLEVEHCEVALVAYTFNVDGGFAEEVDNALASIVGVAVKDDWSQDEADDFFQEYEDFVLVKSREFGADFVAVEAILPVRGHVVDVHQDFLKVEHRIVAFGFIRKSAVRNTENAHHYRDPEDGRAAFGDFEAQEEFRVEQGCQSQDTSKSTADKSYKSAQLIGLVFRKLLEVVDCEWVGLTYAALEQVIQFVELADLPFRERCEGPQADSGGITRELGVVTEEVENGESYNVPGGEEDA